MLAWLAGFALIPPNAKLDNGEQHLVQVLRAHTAQLHAAALLAALGAVLLAAFFAVLTRLVPEGNPGWGPNEPVAHGLGARGVDKWSAPVPPRRPVW